MDFRKIVTNELKKQGLTKYRLWKMCKGEVGQATISDFLSGKGNITDDKLSVIFSALGIKIEK